MRLIWLTLASLSCAGAAWAQAELQPFVTQLRLNGRMADAMAWRDARGEVFVSADDLASLGVSVPTNADRIALSSVHGLRYTLNEADAAIDITCAAGCFRRQTINGDRSSPASVQRDTGGFLNYDLAAEYADHRSEVAGLFELGLFGAYGSGASTFAARSGDGQLVRLETQWTFDRPANRTSLRIGDSITRGGAGAAPLRFGGLQFGTDFSLDPSFVTFPAPTFNGEAAAPSTVDLYVDGALRLRETVDAGPFSVVDAPVLSGAGVAQVVVTDALGRQQIFAQPFYVSPSMLRRGLADYSLAIGCAAAASPEPATITAPALPRLSIAMASPIG